MPLSAFLLWMMATSSPAASAETAHPGQEVETAYAEAVLAYNGREYSRTVKLLNALLKVQPTNVEALELQALTLKTLGDDRMSLETYKRLIQIKPESERGPYHFEAGVILYKNKKLEDARPQLERAARLGFNVTASHFFLGNIGFQLKDRRLAESSFLAVLKDPNGAELRVAARYYLGLIRFQNGQGSAATQELMLAKKEADKLPGNKVAQDIGEAAAKALSPFDRGQWFGNVSLITQYDGNVTLASSSSSAASGNSSIIERVSLGLGRMSSPMRGLQWVASHRINYNKNFNSAVKDYEFFANVPSLYLTANPLAKTNFGVKFEGNYSFKNTLTGTAATFRPYTQSLEIGPYARTAVIDRTLLSLEAFYRAQKFPQDAGGGTTVRSGNVATARLSAKRDLGKKLLNPDADVTYELNYARGSDMRSDTLTVGASNVARLSAKDALTFSIDYSNVSYPDAAQARSDSTLTLRFAWLRTLSPKWAIIGDAGYSKNSSNITTYVYAKPSLSLGVSYSL